MIRLVIADDHALVREGFHRLFEARADISLEGVASDGDELLGILETTPADVIILDISMPGPGFSSLMNTIRERWPESAVLVVSMHPEESWAVRALKAGASGYLPKSRSAEELTMAIRVVHSGEKYVTSALGAMLAERLLDPAGGEPHESLTPREKEVFLMLGGGMMLKNVARELNLSPKTVSTHRRRILDKLGLNSTAELVRYTTERKLI